MFILTWKINVLECLNYCHSIKDYFEIFFVNNFQLSLLIFFWNFIQYSEWAYQLDLIGFIAEIVEYRENMT